MAVVVVLTDHCAHFSKLYLYLRKVLTVWLWNAVAAYLKMVCSVVQIFCLISSVMKCSSLIPSSQNCITRRPASAGLQFGLLVCNNGGMYWWLGC